MAKGTEILERTQTSSRARPGRPPRQGRAFAALTWASILGQVRNLSTLIFGFLFPLAFIAVFGLFNNSGPTKVNLGIVDGTDTTTPVYQLLSSLQDHPTARLKLTLTLGSQDALTNKLSHGDLDGVLTITAVTRTVTMPPVVASPGASPVASPTASPVATGTPGSSGGQAGQPTTRSIPGYDLSLVTSKASPQSAAAAIGVVSGVASGLNDQMATLPVKVKQSDIQGQAAFNYIDFALPGMLGFSLLSIAIFGTAFGFVVLKQTLVLKRIFATPTRPTTIVLAQGAARLIIAVLQVVVILFFGISPFIGFHLAQGAATFAQMLVVALFGLVCFLGMGLIVAGNFRDENAMGPVINLITLPQFLLSGTFFPTDSFPDWIKPLANNMPLSYLNVALRDIASQGATLWDVRVQLLGLAVWGVITYAIAIKTFKWE